MTKIVAILVLGFINYILRVTPFIFFSKNNLPEWLRKWLTNVPIAVLCAMLAPMLFVTNGNINLSLSNHYLLAAIPTFLLGAWTKNMGVVLATGIIFMAIINHFLV